MNKFIFLIITLALATTLNSYADEESAYAENARLRIYPGGADESDLKVQAVLKRTTDLKKKGLVPGEPTEGF